MMPGRAIGSTRNSEIASRPKNRNRCTPKAAAEPSTSASNVAARPAFTESQSADLDRGVVPRHREPVRREVLDRPALHVRAVEGEDHDGGDRHEKEHQNADHPGDQRHAGSTALHLHRLERAERPRPEEVDDHDHDRHEGKGGGEREVVGQADVVVDDVADEVGARP